MITHLALLKKKAEYEQLLKVIQKYAAIYTDEMWSYLYAQSVSGAEALLAAEPVLDFISWDVTVKDALTALEKMRSFHRDAFLMVVADISVSPMAYLKPGIFPGALLMKPVNRQDLEQVMRDLFEVLTKRFDCGQADTFLVETREGKQYIPLGQIDYFEAKEKKVFVRTKSCEYGFYDALEALEDRLPAGFVRCHRSYIVNMKRARNLNLSEHVIVMADDVEVPFSRSYRKALKEYLKDE